MSRVPEKRLNSDPNMDLNEQIEEIPAANKVHDVAQVFYHSNESPNKQGGNNNGGKIVFKASTKKKIQLTFEDVLIKTIPQKRRCGKRPAVEEQPKVILNNVSGTIMPGQFLAIIGASGKY
jgi:ABC-type multidrug transport system fused ATPase/permease subunit